MKPHIVVAVISVALLVTCGAYESSAASGEARIQSGVMEFNEPVKLLDVTLKGEYLFLHHEGMMERGKPCTFVYRHAGGFVTSFHCRPVKRERTEQFKVVLSHNSACDLPVIEEIQFAGSTEAHLVHH